MKRSLCVALRCLFTLTFGICTSSLFADPHPWPMFRHDASRTGASDLPGPADPGLLWSFSTLSSIPYINGIFSSAAVSSDGTAYVGAFDNNLYALTSRGALDWSYATEFFLINSPAIGGGGNLHFGSASNFYSLSSAGALAWSYQYGTDPELSSPAVATDGSVYAGSSDNRLFAFTSAGSLIWSYRVGEDVDCSPALGNNGRVYFGSSDNSFYTLLSDGSLLWSYKTGDYADTTPAVAANGRAFFAGEDDRLYALASSGLLSWSYEMGAVAFGPPGSSAPALTGSGSLYVASSDDRFYCFASNGALSWSFMAGMPFTGGPVIGEADVGYANTPDGVLRAFNSDGTLLWTYASGTPFSMGTNLALAEDRKILLSSLGYFGGGGLQCIGERPPSLDVITSSDSPAVGDPFTVDVTVKTIGGAFDAWGVILAPGGKIFSFSLGNPSALRSGMHPLALNVPGLRDPYARTLLSLPAIPGNAAGTYTIIVGLVPAGRSPTLANAIPDYVDQEIVTVQ